MPLGGILAEMVGGAGRAVPPCPMASRVSISYALKLSIC